MKTLVVLLIVLLAPRTVIDKQTYSRYEDVPPPYQHLFDATIPQATYNLLFTQGMACAVSYKDFVTATVDAPWDCRWKPARN